ncbi:MAG TPA: MoxR family ATPase, partial [Longimicrobium sp.]|nr:MoxR family ATPase [Longimicrobium sp.]
MEFTRRYFDPSRRVRVPQPPGASAASPPYLYTDEIILAINVALATKRPLLIAGPPGSGKSTLARDIAAVKGWRYLHQVITSRSQVDDLLAGFDALRRLNDAQAQKLLPDTAYVEPGIFWWAFDPESARRRGTAVGDGHTELGERLIAPRDPSEGSGLDAVVLLDEIDKADPDVPNDLLEPLDLKSFQARYVEKVIEARGEHLLTVITTNGERELPPAFVRRCVFLNLSQMDPDRLVRVAEVHCGPDRSGELYRTVAEWLVRWRETARARGLREPGTAEYLDTI